MYHSIESKHALGPLATVSDSLAKSASHLLLCGFISLRKEREAIKLNRKDLLFENQAELVLASYERMLSLTKIWFFQ